MRMMMVVVEKRLLGFTAAGLGPIEWRPWDGSSKCQVGGGGTSKFVKFDQFCEYKLLTYFYTYLQ
jgi:hypothetical protein